MPDALQHEATAVLQRLVRINTVNPPGNERPGAGVPRRPCSSGAGLEVSLLGDDPERPNLVARLRGRAPGPVLGLLSHVDTVVADPAGWRHDPWSGALDEGCVWGRGRARHEVPDRRRGRGRLLARPRGLAPGARGSAA